VTRKVSIDLSETSAEVEVARALGLGSWGALASIPFEADCADVPVALKVNKITVNVRIDKSKIPPIQAHAVLN
jgi:hypothetical protein